MAFDPELADLLRAEVEGQGTITEKKMFGGLCFMLNGNMVCGLYKDGGMFRVAKGDNDDALEVPGTTTMIQSGRPALGFILTTADVVRDPERRGILADMALNYVKSLKSK